MWQVNISQKAIVNKLLHNTITQMAAIVDTKQQLQWWTMVAATDAADKHIMYSPKSASVVTLGGDNEAKISSDNGGISRIKQSTAGATGK